MQRFEFSSKITEIRYIELRYLFRFEKTTFFSDPKLTYDCRKHQLVQLSGLLILISGSLREEDMEFAKNALRRHIPVAFACSKCDLDLTATAHERNEDISKNSREAFIKHGKPLYLTHGQGRVSMGVCTLTLYTSILFGPASWGINGNYWNQKRSSE